MKHGWGWGAAIALLVATAAHGQPDESAAAAREGILKRVDRDGDGKIGYEEYRNAMMRRFSAADGNADGVLKGDEIPRRSLVVDNSKAKIDEVTLHDYSDALRPLFDSFDADRDGALADGEIDAMRQARHSMKEAQP